MKFALLVGYFPGKTLDIYTESLFKYYRNTIDPFWEIPAQSIIWVDPKILVRHEYTSRPHLESLLSHLQVLEDDEMVPIPVITTSTPPVILDGHHRVAASRILELEKIPAWQVNEFEEELDWEASFIRCYKRTDGKRMAMKELISGARKGRIDWGIKGTKHVAVISTKDNQFELELERVTPRIPWAKWLEHRKNYNQDY